eukprot:1219717-Amphidinium_carterae.1
MITVKWVNALASMQGKCGTCKAVLDFVLHEASSVIDMIALVGELASDDVKESLRGRQVQMQKRRRIDEHVRTHLMGAAQSRHSSASSGGTRLSLHVDHNVRSSWIARRLRQQLEHLWLKGENEKDIVISMDGVRIGRPGEETYSYIAWLPVLKQFCHLPPQVLWKGFRKSCSLKLPLLFFMCVAENQFFSFVAVSRKSEKRTY